VPETPKAAIKTASETFGDLWRPNQYASPIQTSENENIEIYPAGDAPDKIPLRATPKDRN